MRIVSIHERLSCWTLTIFCLAVAAAAALGPQPVQAEDLIDSPMYKDPAVPGPPEVYFIPEETKRLWLKALEWPEAEWRSKAAIAIAAAHRSRLIPMNDAVAPLLQVLEQPNQPATVQLAVAQALIALEERQAAAGFMHLLESGSVDFQNIVEPALAHWDHKPARALWLRRLADLDASPRSLQLAIHCLQTVGENQAAEPLRKLLSSAQAPDAVRLAAARALGGLVNQGLEKEASHLASNPSQKGMPGRLAAALLLQNHRSAEAVRLLLRLLRDEEPVVAAAAMAGLVKLEPCPDIESFEQIVARSDANLRLIVVEYLAKMASAKALSLLGDLLEDVHPDVRGKARQALLGLAGRPGLRDAVIAQATRILAGKSWRGLEQAAILLVHLDHKPAAQRLVTLLTFDRPEVFISAAWGLRKLAVPAALPDVLSYVEAELGRLIAQRPLPNRQNVASVFIDHQLSQLNQLLGRQHYLAADKVLRNFIPPRRPPGPVGAESRAAAVWALGILHEGKMDLQMARALEARLNDISMMSAEDGRVRRMSAVTLGRLGAKETLASLHRHYRDKAPSRDHINNACGWAIARITGEPMVEAKPIRLMRRDWFLIAYP